MRRLKRLLKFISFLTIFILVMMIIGLWILSKEKYQNILTQRAAKYLSEKLKTKVSVKHVGLTFFNHFNLDGIYVQDEHKDTLAYIGTLQLKTSELLSDLWNNQTPVLHHAELNHVLVNLRRSKDSSRWNFDFVQDAFSSGTKDTAATIPDTLHQQNAKSNPIIDIKELQLQDIRVNMLDAWRGEDMTFAFDQVDLNISQFQLDKKNIQLRLVAIDQASVHVKEYDGGKPEDNTPDDTTSWGTPFNPEQFAIGIDQLKISNSNFSYIVEGNIPNPKEFDEKNIIVKDIHLNLSNTRIKADTLFSNIDKLTAKERCGLEIKEVNAKVKLSQIQSLLYDMTLKTNHSVLSHTYEMRYKNFHDFKDYINKVYMKAHLRNSYVSSLDVGYFANILNQYPIQINVAGDAEGTVKDMQARNLTLSTLQTQFNGDAHVTGLPNLDETLFDVQATSFNSSGSDINQLIPQTRTNNLAWNALKHIQYIGNYRGKINHFFTKGSLTTNLGNALFDLDMNFIPSVPTYKGELATEQFDIGQLIKQSDIGNLSMKGHIDGQGFDLNTLKAKVNASISHFVVNGSSYSQLTINGLVENKKFDGIFISQDEKLTMNFNGKLDLSGKQPSYDFSSRFVYFNLQKMGLSKDPITGSGYAQLKFTGDNVDNFTGSAFLKNIHIENLGKTISINEINVQSSVQDNMKILELKSSIANATLKGQYAISTLVPTVQMFLYHYLPQYIKKPIDYQNQSFSFIAKINDVDSITSTLFPSIKGISNSYIDAYINSKEQKLSLDVTVPQLGFDNLLLNKINIVSAGDYNNLDLSATGGEVVYNNETIIPSLQLISSMAHDTASLALNTQSINELLGEASINCKATAMNSNLFIHLLPSSIRIKDDHWQFYSNQDMVVGQDIYVNDFIVENGAQKIIMNTNQTITNNLVMDLENIDLESLSSYFSSSGPTMHGRISGQIAVDDFVNQQMVHAQLFSTQILRINNDTLGALTAYVDYDVSRQVLTIRNNSSLFLNQSTAVISGQINTKDSTINLNTNVNHTNIAFLNQFLADYITNLNGSVTGNVRIMGSLRTPSITGSLHLENGKCKVLFLGTTYTIAKADLKFNNEKIEMENFLIKDEREGNYTGVVKGYISHHNFTDFNFNLHIDADNLLCLNTKENDNDLFYGYVPGNIEVGITGELNDILVAMDIKPLKGAVFNMPINSTGDASTYDYVEFAEFGRSEEEINKKKKKVSYLKLDMNIEATPDALVNIILDNNTGEEIVARGNGNIHMTVDLGNDVAMSGSYMITKGFYNFNFRGVLPRVFNIEEGSKVTWIKDPLMANLEINAVYQNPNPLSLYPLISLNAQQMDAQEIQEAKKKYITYIPIYLTGPLNNPDIKFDIIQPDNKAVGTPGYNALEKLRSNDNELISQAGVVLLLGDFKASDGGITNTAINKGALTTVSDVVTNYVSSEITNQFQNLTGLKFLNVNFNYQNKTDVYTENANNVNQFSATVSLALFKQRVMVDFENSIDVSKSTAGSNSNYAGNFKAQFLITEDGRLRLNTYRISDPNIDGTANNGITKSGLGLSYRQVFNRFSDLYGGKRRRPKPTVDNHDIHPDGSGIKQ